MKINGPPPFRISDDTWAKVADQLTEIGHRLCNTGERARDIANAMFGRTPPDEQADEMPDPIGGSDGADQ